MTEFRLIAEDDEDLQVISAHLQDAVLHVGDIAFLPSARRFALVANRFRWERAISGSQKYERVRCGVHFENVLRARSRNISQDRKDGVLNLLSIQFQPDDAPSGTVKLVFSGGGEIDLSVEALEVELNDLSDAWKTDLKPAHKIEE